MEFKNKLQELRKQSNMTQEDLAKRLFVSRTAVSKWESGKGYPSIESLQRLSVVFSISIDELLSSNELLTMSECENKLNILKLKSIVYGILDMIFIIFIFLPLYSDSSGEYVRAVNLLNSTDISYTVRIGYIIIFIVMTLLGICEMAVIGFSQNKIKRLGIVSIVIHSITVVFLVLIRQPYITLLAFLTLIIKVIINLTGKQLLGK